MQSSLPPLDALGKHPQLVLSDVDAALALADSLEAAARYIAHNLTQRAEILHVLQQQLGQDAFERIAAYWIELIPRLDTSIEPTEETRAVALALAKAERNLIAGLAEHQAAARRCGHEELVRGMLFKLTSFARMEDDRYHLLQAVMCQLLVNLVSPISDSEADQAMADEALARYASGRREDDIVIRLLDSQDVKVNTATIHLISNLTRGSLSRTSTLLTPPALSWLSRLLTQLDTFHAAPQPLSHPASAPDNRFELVSSLLTNLATLDLHAHLFTALSAPDEPISPSQTALLKVLDSYLSPTPPASASPSQHAALHSAENAFLVPAFRRLGRYVLASRRSGVDDARLPKAMEGLHLVSELLCCVGLEVQREADERERRAGVAGETESERGGVDGAVEVVRAMKDGNQDVGIVGLLVATLQDLEVLLPRTNPRIARAATVITSEASFTNSAPPVPSPALLTPDRARPIAALKRILVQLLGVLTFGDVSVSDQVREAGGVVLLLGMTEVDEGNPYLREHALFAVRNLMRDNPRNQAVVAQMDPVGVLGQDGEVLPVPEKMKRGANGSGGSGSA